MHGFILWCGFFGGWLLFAGPVYQAALELGEERRHSPDLAAVVFGPQPRTHRAVVVTAATGWICVAAQTFS